MLCSPQVYGTNAVPQPKPGLGPERGALLLVVLLVAGPDRRRPGRSTKALAEPAPSLRPHSYALVRNFLAAGLGRRTAIIPVI